MRSLPCLALALLVPFATPRPARADVIPSRDANQTPRQITVGEALLKAMGGRAAWSRARYFQFDWIVEKEGKRVVMRSHHWDRWNGRYRVDGTDEKGVAWSVWFNVNTRAGTAVVGGQKVTDAAQAKKWLDDGYEAYINDSYWLLAPFKVFDPGVSVGDGGVEKGPNGEPCDVLTLSFENVGLTPKDHYWLYVNQKSHLVDQWKYVLGGENKPPTAWAWSDWKTVGPIQLASMRKGLTKPNVIRFENLKVSLDVDEAALTPPK
jgi:hypothetical protein